MKEEIKVIRPYQGPLSGSMFIETTPDGFLFVHVQKAHMEDNTECYQVLKQTNVECRWFNSNMTRAELDQLQCVHPAMLVRMLDLLVEYMRAEHGKCNPKHLASCLTPEELGERASDIIKQMTGEYPTPCQISNPCADK